MQWARTRAEQRDRAHFINVAFVLERLEKGCCEVSGIPFNYTPGSAFAPSLDRKDSAGGYTPDNTQVVVLIYNRMKGAGTHEQVMKLAEAICRTHAKK